MSIDKMLGVYESLGFRERALFRRACDLGLLSDVSCDWCHEPSDWTKSPNLKADFEGLNASCPSCGKASQLTWNALDEEFNLAEC